MTKSDIALTHKFFRLATALFLALYLLAFGPMTAWAASGDLLWEARTPGDGNDIVVDNAGNVYVTSGRQSSTFKTIKYDPNGQLVWANEYGPGHATALVVDDDGNVFVTGYSSGLITVKYNSNGIEKWARSYPDTVGERNDIKLDKRGNVYVIGNWALVKYRASTGSEKWAIPGGGSPRGRLALDSNDYIYVMNENGIITKYREQNGVQIWQTDTGLRLHDMAVNNDGVYSVGTGYITNKLSLDTGAVKWTKALNYGGFIGADALGVAIGGAGNIYVAGYANSPLGNTDIVTVNYDAAGSIIWASPYDGIDSGMNAYIEVPDSIAVDTTGNVYVAAESESLNSYYDYATIKYDSQGNRVWVQRYDSGYNDADWETRIAVNTTGVYVTGNSWNPYLGYREAATLKYTP